MINHVFRAALAALALSFAFSGTAYAWHVEGYVYCDQTGLPLGNVVVNVVGSSGTGPFTGSDVTGDDGHYVVALPDNPGSYDLSLDLSGAGGGTIVSPGASYHLDTADGFDFVVVNWTVNSPGCSVLGCWLTGGGAKFSSVTGTYLAEKTSWINFGGNVYPGCSPTAGDGGQWNHVDKDAKLHFQGNKIVVDRCGNVDGIPPGSTSPATPFNFIEFHGTGVLKGISGNKTNQNVCFEGRAEDRNEPGSTGQRDGAGKDRYYIRVTDCAGNTLLFLEDPAQPGDKDPVTITDGNLQIHVSSCQ